VEVAALDWAMLISLHLLAMVPALQVAAGARVQLLLAVRAAVPVCLTVVAVAV